MPQINWIGLLPLNKETLNTISDGAGVFRLAYKASDGSKYVFYVGKSDNSIKTDLLSLLDNPVNDCVKSYLENLPCFFKYTIENDPVQRENIERTIYEYFHPKCNTTIPQGKSSGDINIQ